MYFLLKNLDTLLFRLINQGMENPVCDRICPLFNNLKPFIPLILLGLGWLIWRKSPRAWTVVLLLVLGALLGDLCVFNPLKSIVARPRPAAVLLHVHELASGATGGYSFPSSHTANAFVMATLLAWFYPRRRWIFYLFAGFVGFCRVYVGVHYPSDILGSAFLGFLTGRAVLQGYQRIEPAFREGKKTSFASPKWPLGVLAFLQLGRLLWCVFTGFDPPPACMQLWRSAMVLHAMTLLGRYGAAFGRAWFGIFGSSSLSLWLIPWAFQTLWLGLLAGLAWKRGRLASLWGLVLIAFFLPLASQLSCLGSPSLIFEESDWSAPRPVLALVYYLLLGWPVWVGTVCFFKRYPLSSGMALAGLILAVSFPGLYWQCLALAIMGVLPVLSEKIGEILFNFRKDEMAKRRLWLFLGVFYGSVLSIAVYNPLFLRKIGISILPRNSPLYTQTGWNEWTHRIHSELAKHRAMEIWCDSEISRDQLQYFLGREYRVVGPRQVMKNWKLQEEHSPLLPPRFYIREVYLAQIHPQVIFLRRNDWLPRSMQKRMLEIESFVIFRHGDPIRQFQIFMLDAEAS